MAIMASKQRAIRLIQPRGEARKRVRQERLTHELGAGQGEAPPATPFKQASYCRFYDTPPSIDDAGAKTWLARGQNLIVAYSEVSAGAVLTREAQLDEYAVMITDAGLSVEISAGDQVEIAHGPCLAFVPPGASRVKALGSGVFYRLITARAADLAALCANADVYAEADPNVPPFEQWPDPVGGYRIRVYSGDVPSEQGRFWPALSRLDADGEFCQRPRRPA
ncbi:MAG: hypothetical protein NVV62_13480 [Terricaulis sp.]|nr:hypothetical protein [Terricaulis sp.]